jgi:hypothetical protein
MASEIERRGRLRKKRWPVSGPRLLVRRSGRQTAYSAANKENDEMLYAILCYDSEEVVCSWTKEEDDAVLARLGVVQEQLAAAGRLGPVARLMPTTAATTIRKGKEAVVIDGPFAETKEQLLGFFIVECDSLEQAVETAKAFAAASSSAGAYEIRPLRLFRPGSVDS